MNKTTTAFLQWGLVLLLATCVCMVSAVSVQADNKIEFLGTVISVDLTAGKLAVKKEGGGTRFTFVVNDKTAFQGAGLASLKDLRKDDKVTVLYHVQNSQYLAISVTRR